RRQDQPRREAETRSKSDEGNAEIGAERVERSAGEIEDFLHAEYELQAGGDQKQHGGVEDAAEQDIGKRRHRGWASDLELRGLDPVPEIGAGRLLQVSGEHRLEAA